MRYLYTILLIVGLTSFNFADVVLVGSKDNPLDSVSASDLKKFYTGKSKKLGGKKMSPVILKKGATHEDFMKKYVKMSGSKYSRYITKLVFTGKAKMPKSFSDEGDVIDYVADNDDVVGYVSSDSVGDGVKVIKVK